MGQNKDIDTEKTRVIKAMEITIVTSALLSTKPINDAWASLTDEGPMSIESNFIVRSEMLWFFLHMMDRFAFEIGGPEVRATLLDTVVENAIQGILTASFDSSHAKKGFDSEEWLSRMASDMLEDYNEAASDYGSCTSLVDELPDPSGKRTIIGKLGARIGRQVDQQYNMNLLILISMTAADALVKSQLKKQVEEACSILR